MKKIILIFLIFTSFIGNAQDNEISKFIKAESIGGKLDFTKVAEEQAQGSYFVLYEDILYNKKDFAILMWGAKVKSLGIENIKTVNKLWEEINRRDLTDAEKRALKKGFELKMEN